MSLKPQSLREQQGPNVGVLQLKGARVLADSLGQVAILLRDQAKHDHERGLAGHEPKGLFESLFRLRQIPRLPIGGSQVVISGSPLARFGRAKSHHLISFGGRRRVAAALLIGSEDQVGGPIVGTDGERGANMLDGLLGFALLVQRGARAPPYRAGSPLDGR